MICPNCGKKNREGASFCDACGTPLEAPETRAPVPDLPSVAGGRYVARAFLGQGGRKQVFRALDTRLDREVALSVIHTEGLDQASIERVRREARAMARLGDHPNIVNIFDVGEEPGLIFLIAELMPGGSVDELLNRARGPLALERVLTVARQVAAALEYVHEQGVVHRDIKPANVWLSRDGTAKLGDFGLAAGTQAVKLTSEGMMLGTVAYMAPEQATGGEVDARSDLYSLGALLYEAATGKPPFAGDDAIAVISQQIHTAPVAPTWHNPGVPPALESLILDLLAKSPADRPQSAAEVLARLEALSGTQPVVETAATPDNPLDRLAGGVFVGREAESRELRLMLDAARKGSGGVALLVGEPGIGKTRMAEELATYGRMNGAQVLTGRCYEGEGAPAYWPWIQVIRSSVHDRSAEALASEMGSGAGYIAEIVSDVKQALPNVQSPAGTDLESSRFQLFDSVTTFLRNAARHRPMVVFLDDVHWADKPSLLLLDFVSRQLRDAKILVVCTYRDIELGRQHPLSQSLASIFREPNTRRILLRGLTEADVARYIKLTVGSEPAESLVRAIQTETEGNPFFVSETVRLLASEGRLEAGTASSWSLTIPQGVKEVIGRRLDMLSAECNQVLTLASVLGREFELPAIELLTGKPPEDLLEALDEAVAARVLAPAAGGYRFAHALIRETLYDELSTAKRLRLHKAAGEVLEKLGSDDPDRFLSELAHHFFESSALGEVDKAIGYARRAGDKAMRQLAFEEAAVQYDHALQALELSDAGDEEEHCRLLLALGQAQISSAEIPAALRTFRAAFKHAQEAGLVDETALAALGIGDVLTDVGSVSQELVETLEAALAAGAGRESALRVRLLARLGEAYRFDPSTKHKEDELTREALALARRVGDPLATAQALYGRVIALGEGRETLAQIGLCTELIETAIRAGDIERRLLGLRMRMILLFFTNRLSEARRDVEEYARLAEKAKLPLYTWFTPLFQSTWSLAEGGIREAAELVTRAIRQGTQARDPNVRRFSVGAELTTAYELQDSEQLSAVLEHLREPNAFRWYWAPRIFATAVTGETSEAHRLLNEVVAGNFRTVNTDFGLLWAVQLLTEVCRRLDDESNAAVLYDMAAQYGARLSAPGYLVTTGGCGHHHLGVLATILKRYNEARYHLDAALEIHTNAGFSFLATQTRLAQARLFHQRGGPGDDQECRRLVARVVEESKRGGFRQTLEQAIQLQLEAGKAPADEASAIAGLAAAVQGDGSIIAGPSPDGTVTILFTDIEGSTELNEDLGDQQWLDLLAAHDRIVRQEVARAGGTVVKSRGDGFMLAFPSARQALAAAIACQRSLARHNARSPGSPPIRVRIGVHTGEVVKQSGDFFGRHVNYASRIADKARGGEILVSELTKALVQGSPEFRFDPAVPVELKGFSGSHPTFRLRWSG
ncbi:MAG TPA: protein kinase [Actinomycetota bacterium]|nr:protein kinase [Actinomycetota bacterium]